MVRISSLLGLDSGLRASSNIFLIWLVEGASRPREHEAQSVMARSGAGTWTQVKELQSLL